MFGRLRERLQKGLRKTRQALADKVAQLGLAGRKVDEALIEEVEEILVTADLGYELAEELCEHLRHAARGRELSSTAELMELLEEGLLARMPERAAELRPAAGPRVTLMVGVNGSGKTTTTGKLAARLAGEGRRVIVAAADTFRAAAVEQLVVWAERAGARVIRARPGSDPAAVAFDAVRAAKAGDYDEVLVDTAGRLHTKKPLMDELTKISRAVAKEIEAAPHETLLVVDGTTGRNGIAQAREFSQAVGVTGLVLTKLDGTARGGVAVSIGRELGLPVRYVGMGEDAADLLDYDPAEYARGLVSGAEFHSGAPGSA
ncbi:MAG: signal recognition particle-docking protein FtsY [Acidobacteriota bacterium]|nr:signal recognition particle-docking protein FtsY [Acidobacteriota bacterium]MDQ7086821.1 signal recognition particle-docking protein FtsY [Acidobacteriota bacterium]